MAQPFPHWLIAWVGTLPLLFVTFEMFYGDAPEALRIGWQIGNVIVVATAFLTLLKSIQVETTYSFKLSSERGRLERLIE